MPIVALMQTGTGQGTLLLLGSVALLLLLLNRSRRRRAQAPAASPECMKTRLSLARMEIAQIDADNWLRKHSGATRIPRRALGLGQDELESLRRISARQAHVSME
jgi:hypothetical protein